MNCGTCNSEIRDDEPRMIFRESSEAPDQITHVCCFQEEWLFEVWNALSLGIKYESHCAHVDYTSRFNPATFTPQDVAKAVEKQMKNRQGSGGRKWWRR